ncbi:MAG: ABC transporter ATP-binding protein [Dactylosporangium sp.]|nr:ABC transporter ATP-binding protein [Dactylosporangium sp.]NNJ60507.1 ABC transporter ATP-binding protein [Dactylosporangium sp.]
MGDRAIQTRGVTRRYGSVTAVDQVDLTVARGEIYGFLGRNGAGKTTLIRLLLGLIRPTAGTVEVLGRPVAGPADRRPAPWSRVGYLVEDPGLYPDLTVLDHLRIAARYRGLDATAVTDILTSLDLGRYARSRARTLSTGNRQRLGLATALIHRPELVILDEPANGLDPAGVVEVRDLLRALADGGVTVFMSSHIIGEVSRLADRVGVIHEGALVAELSVDDLRALGRQRLVVAVSDPEHVDRADRALRAAGVVAEVAGTTLVCSEALAVGHPERVATLLVEAGAPPSHLAVEREDLEQHFLRLTGGEPS